MSLRAYTDHIDDYNREHTLEIHKEGYSGDVDYLKNTGEGFGSFDYEKIDPKNPTENPIQKGALEFSVWIHTDDLIDEIKTSDEQTFWAVHKVDGTQEWQGYIYNDLSTYEENILPYRITIMAKDFTDLGGKDYLVGGSLPDARENVIETIAYLLNTVGFDIPIKTHTSWIEENLEGSGDYDYLNQIYHETKALRNFGRTGDETDQPITVEEALNKLCANHGLLLKQANGCYWIDQLTEYDDPENVQEAEYNLSGTQQSLSTGNDLTVDAPTDDLRVVIQQNNRDNSGLPGLKRVESRYNHRTNIITQFVPSRLTITDTEPDQFFEQEIGYNGNQEILLRFDVSIVHGSGGDSASLNMTLSAGGQTWDSSSEQWIAPGSGGIEIDLTETSSGFRASVEIITDSVPTDDDNLGVTFRKATVDGSTADFTAYTNIFLQVQNPVNIERNSEGIVYQLTQNGRYSVESELDDTWYGDGPELYSPGALRYEDALDSITEDSFQRRGSTNYRNLHHNLLAEHLDPRRGWRRLLSALLKGKYYAWQILSYDSQYFYFIGGSWDLWTGNWQGELLALDISTDN